MEKVITGQRIMLDSQVFVETQFVNCELVYQGGRPPTLLNNEFTDCRWTFDGPAANTAAFMKALYQSGAKELILLTIGAKDGA